MIDISPSYCTGCGLCAANCPKQAIDILQNSNGSFFSKVNPSLCVNCGLCDKLCPLVSPTFFAPKQAFLCYAKSKEARIAGSSGGFFGLLATSLIKEGWYVCGAGWNGLKVEHRIIHDVKDLPLLEKSKYVQSSLGTVFPQIKKLLFSGEKIAFVGTPCQVEGLRKYLRGRFDKQVLFVDFLCHGVPPQAFFDRCIAEEEKSKKIKILSFSFRAKSRNNPHSFSYHYTANGFSKIRVKTGVSFEFPYYFAFLSYMVFIPSCYHCQFAQPNRCGDITLGDGWESESVDSHFQTWGRKKGVSEILVNTSVGQALFSKISPQLCVKTIPFDFISKTNASFSPLVSPSQDRIVHLWADFSKDFSATLYHNFQFSKSRLAKEKFAQSLPRWVFNLAHRIHHFKK
jgi:coenzyme F420-reducing hydrogenase beta subunit